MKLIKGRKSKTIVLLLIALAAIVYILSRVMPETGDNTIGNLAYGNNVIVNKDGVSRRNNASFTSYAMETLKNSDHAHKWSHGRRRDIFASVHDGKGIPNITMGLSKADVHGDDVLSAIGDVPLMRRYCNSPFVPVTGSEGAEIEGLKLQMVHVFIRHGDRAPLHRIHGFWPRDLDCNFESWYDGSDLKTQQYATRMGLFSGKQLAKSYFRDWPLLPKNRNRCSGSELTSHGALQHINLGKFLREQYVNGSDIFDSDTDIYRQLFVLSTKTKRTYQSANALLYGFLSELNVTRLDVKPSLNVYLCTAKLSERNMCFCKNTSVLQARSQKYAADVKRQSYKRLTKSIKEIFHMKRDEHPSLSHIMDAFAPSICHLLSVPCSSTKPVRCVNSSTIAAMWSEMVQSQREVLEDPDKNHLKFASIMLYPILAEMTNRMVSMAEGKHVPRFILYSGHDLTITSLLYVLGLHDGMWPPYASRVVLELYRSDVQQDPSEYLVRVLYNGQDLTRNVSFCKVTGHHGLCNLRDLAKFVYSEMIQRFGFDSFNSACSKGFNE